MVDMKLTEALVEWRPKLDMFQKDKGAFQPLAICGVVDTKHLVKLKKFRNQVWKMKHQFLLFAIIATNESIFVDSQHQAIFFFSNLFAKGWNTWKQNLT